MQISYDEVGVEGSPVLLPHQLRRLLARLASNSPKLFAAMTLALHRLWALGGRFQHSEVARFWCKMAGDWTYGQALDFARAVEKLGTLPTFREGSGALGFRTPLEAMMYRGALFDPFFQSGPWPEAEYTDPHQRPIFFVPGIPAQRYYDPVQFGWTRLLEESADTIRDELLNLVSEDGRGFANYRTEFGNLMPGWNAYHFYIQGEPVLANCRRCPRTWELLESLPRMEKEFILFSALNPRSRILPHVGALNGILRFHLPLLLPKGCGLKVGGQTAQWQEGKVLVFDDSFVHEVWNDSDQLRVVLFLNRWHPCLSEPETRALSNLQKAYNRLPGGKAWKEAQHHPAPTTLEAGG